MHWKGAEVWQAVSAPSTRTQHPITNSLITMKPRSETTTSNITVVTEECQHSRPPTPRRGDATAKPRAQQTTTAVALALTKNCRVAFFWSLWDGRRVKKGTLRRGTKGLDSVLERLGNVEPKQRTAWNGACHLYFSFVPLHEKGQTSSLTWRNGFNTMYFRNS